jgi:hypothetical protein
MGNRAATMKNVIDTLLGRSSLGRESSESERLGGSAWPSRLSFPTEARI